MPTVLVTGANRGLGLEFVKQYAAAGLRVIATARDPNAPGELRSVAASAANVSLHQLEVSDGRSVAQLARELSGQPIDILINNAGTMGPERQRLGQIDFDGMLDTLRINTLGPLRLAEALADNVARSERKLMVGITSGMGSIADSSGGYYAYRASKAALNMTFRNLALDLKGRGVIAVVINPGWVQTDMGGHNAPTTPEASIQAMRSIFERLTLQDSGSFLNYKGGTFAW